MLSSLPVSLFSLFLVSASSVHAFDINVRVRTPASTNGLSTRDSKSIIPVHNTHNAEYIANITLGGREIPVLLDTGSSDLWVTGSVPNTKDTGKAVSINYAVGRTSGDIHTADLDFAGYQIKDQAYLLVEDTSSFSLDIKAQGFEGLIGLGPNTGSNILDKIDDDSAASVLNRIYSQNTTAQNYMTMLLDRISAANQTFKGQMTISEVIPGFESILNMPKLEVDKVHRLTDADQHWQTFTDDYGVIGPDGQPIDIESIVPKADDHKLAVVFDSGYTLPQVPRKMADAIYGRVQGARYDEDMEVWTVPCGQELNLTFKFGGNEYPVHPLDTVSSDFNVVDPTGKPVCVGTFQPITSAFSLLGEYDIILGMSFMRNTYSLFDYGNWVKGSKNDRQDPYIQLLSVTDKAQAHKDFVSVRLNGIDSTGDSSWQLLPADKGQSSPISKEEKKKMYEEKVLSRWPEIFVGCLGFVLIVVGIVTWRCCVARRRRRALAASKAAALGVSTSGGGQPYKIVDSQGSAMNLHEMSQSHKPSYDNDPYGYQHHKV